ncbi:MAG: GntR family transcriptional regulator, partial [Desulfovibrionales bacterium]|nr:GntR family transcriptional regulator [Desulfovibrionales bacterium]
MITNNLFEPVKAGRAGEDIALQIQAAIIAGNITPGEKLPSERELQSLFKTGRGVVREALQVLKHKG